MQIRGRAPGIGKNVECFSAPKLQNNGAATGPADYAECFVCKSDFTPSSHPLDKDGPFVKLNMAAKLKIRTPFNGAIKRGS